MIYINHNFDMDFFFLSFYKRILSDSKSKVIYRFLRKEKVVKDLKV